MQVSFAHFQAKKVKQLLSIRHYRDNLSTSLFIIVEFKSYDIMTKYIKHAGGEFGVNNNFGDVWLHNLKHNLQCLIGKWITSRSKCKIKNKMKRNKGHGTEFVLKAFYKFTYLLTNYYHELSPTLFQKNVISSSPDEQNQMLYVTRTYQNAKTNVTVLNYINRIYVFFLIINDTILKPKVFYIFDPTQTKPLSWSIERLKSLCHMHIILHQLRC